MRNRLLLLSYLLLFCGVINAQEEHSSTEHNLYLKSCFIQIKDEFNFGLVFSGINLNVGYQYNKAHDYGLKNIFNDSVLEVRRTSAKELSAEVVVVHAKMRLSGQTAIEGLKPQTRQTIFSFVMRKSEHGWLCASAQNTDIILGHDLYHYVDRLDIKGVTGMYIPTEIKY